MNTYRLTVVSGEHAGATSTSNSIDLIVDLMLREDYYLSDSVLGIYENGEYRKSTTIEIDIFMSLYNAKAR